MHADQEEAKNLNGFQVSGFYNVNSWLALGGEFSGLYASNARCAYRGYNSPSNASASNYVGFRCVRGL